ncbi:MAG TPA: hypothetical protein VHQ65_00975 [Thermoanaerobaculia bacterium]|nr:hypothetical protein [Thermoanaerobaculia bacterium]
MSAIEADGDDHAYFQAVEEIFIGLRGAPLLLSPADWRVAQEWHRRGIPLEHVRRALEELFARRRERGTRGVVNSLRYCRKAVEDSWQDVEEMQAGGERTAAPGLDVPARLAALAAALPESLPERAAAARRIRGLSGDTEHVEAALAALDRELLERVEAALDAAGRAAVDAQVEETVASLFGRLFAGDVDHARTRLRRQVLRRHLALPVLSLFSPEAEAGEGDGET